MIRIVSKRSFLNRRFTSKAFSPQWAEMQEEIFSIKAKDGHLTARERISILADPGTFVETRSYSSLGLVTGRCLVNGRTVLVYGQEGSAAEEGFNIDSLLKLSQHLDSARKLNAPVVGLLDCSGSNLDEGLESLGGMNDVLAKQAELVGTIPQISVVHGKCAGPATYFAGLSDFTFMVDKTSMFMTSPDLVELVTKESLSDAELGGAKVHAQNTGLSSGTFSSDLTALKHVRNLISFLPNSVQQQDEFSMFEDKEVDPVDRQDMTLDRMVPNTVTEAFDVKEILYRVVDNGELCEIAPEFAKNLVTGFARFAGQTVGVVANQPLTFAGCLDANACRKGADFVKFCTNYKIPLVTFVDVPGFLPSKAEEHGQVIQNSTELFYSYATSWVPKVTIYLRKAVGAGWICMGTKADSTYCWPSAEVMNCDSTAAAKIVQPDILDHFRRDFDLELANPVHASKLGLIDEIIPPHQTRRVICEDLKHFCNKSTY